MVCYIILRKKTKFFCAYKTPFRKSGHKCLHVNGLKTPPFILGIDGGVEGKYQPKTLPDSESVIIVIFFFRPMP